MGLIGNSSKLSTKITSENIGSKFLSFSIIIEWENFVQSDARHASLMLQNLSKQINQISKKFSSKSEIIIVFNSKDVDSVLVKKFVDDNFSFHPLVDFKFIPSFGLHYYELKNLGAKHSSNDLIIFFDSDVTPEDGWLEGMLQSFQNPDIKVVGGTTHMPNDSIMGKALALVWFTPRKSKYDKLFEVDHFYANNVAFRRKVYQSHPFPQINQFHGQCNIVADKLRKSGFKIFSQPKSRIIHDVPQNAKDFVSWALTMGLDYVAIRRLRNVTGSSGVEQYKFKNSTVRQLISRSRQRFHYSSLKSKDYPAAAFIVLSYFTIMGIGMMISFVRPNYYSYIRKNNWKMWT